MNVLISAEDPKIAYNLEQVMLENVAHMVVSRNFPYTDFEVQNIYHLMAVIYERYNSIAYGKFKAMALSRRAVGKLCIESDIVLLDGEDIYGVSDIADYFGIPVVNKIEDVFTTDISGREEETPKVVYCGGCEHTKGHPGMPDQCSFFNPKKCLIYGSIEDAAEGDPNKSIKDDK